MGCSSNEPCGVCILIYNKISDPAVYPSEDIGIDFSLVYLVEHFVAAVLIQLYGDVLHAGLFKVFIRKLYALAAFADGVLIAGHKVNRHILLHRLEIVDVCNELNSGHHIPEQAACRYKAAKRIGNVFINNVSVAREPIILGARIFIYLIIASEGEVIEKLAVMMRALESRDEISHEKAAVYECCALIASAAYYRSVKAAGIADKMRARHEAAHAVSEQDKRNVRIGLLHCKTKYLLVLYDLIPTVFLGEKAHLLGLSML